MEEGRADIRAHLKHVFLVTAAAENLQGRFVIRWKGEGVGNHRATFSFIHDQASSCTEVSCSTARSAASCSETLIAGTSVSSFTRFEIETLETMASQNLGHPYGLVEAHHRAVHPEHVIEGRRLDGIRLGLALRLCFIATLATTSPPVDDVSQATNLRLFLRTPPGYVRWFSFVRLRVALRCRILSCGQPGRQGSPTCSQDLETVVVVSLDEQDLQDTSSPSFLSISRSTSSWTKSRSAEGRTLLTSTCKCWNPELPPNLERRRVSHGSDQGGEDDRKLQHLQALRRTQRTQRW